jgi:hypothetical protein
VLRQPEGTARSVTFLVLGFHVVSGCLCLARYRSSRPWQASFDAPPTHQESYRVRAA